MPLGIGHFAVGVLGAALVLVATGKHRSVSEDGYFLLVSGLWAVVPDLGQVFEGIPQTDQTVLANVFWFHAALDANAFFDSTEGTAVLGAAMVLSLVGLVVLKRVEGRDVMPLVNEL